ncbi:MAG: alternative ribosome rescue aminoacyl-tRNA hydrolase ArfB [Thermodesulfobacteriota bacterium]|nr:alternative ribosome rescue aminoacyl-tRNA hydrolase ArfB [Thermodesulfobacteriota bacterium]
MIRITPHLSINEEEIKEVFVRASGPGGQNVNKVATAVQLRFDVHHSSSLPEGVKARLIRLGGKRINEKGVLVIEAKRFRTQERNRLNARERLMGLILRAAQNPKERRKTRPTVASVERRIKGKRSHGKTKKMRRPLKTDRILE